MLCRVMWYCGAVVVAAVAAAIYRGCWVLLLQLKILEIDNP